MTLTSACWLGIVGSLGISAAACGGAHARTWEGAGAKVPLAPPGVLVEDDVAAGFAAYRDVLTRWGRWSPDARYGVQWCPNADQVSGFGIPFHPYRTRGHWDASDAAQYGAPPGSPYWVSDDAETWGEITTHHGYWVQRVVDPSGGARAGDWCWVPGTEATAARVVWRSGGGFVGWAPEPPTWVDDGDEGYSADFSWSFVMTGALFESDLIGQLLEGEGQAAAGETTSPSRSIDGHRFVRLGPGASTVASARRELAAYVRAHPEIPAGSPSVLAQLQAKSGSGGGSGSASGTSSGPDSSAKSATKKRADHDEDAMPHAALLVPVMMRDPMLGPIGLTPRFQRWSDPKVEAVTVDEGHAASAASSSGGSSSSSGSASSSSEGHEWTPPAASSYAHGSAAVSHASSGSASSSHASSHSSSASSSSSSSSGSSGSSSSSHSSMRAHK